MESGMVSVEKKSQKLVKIIALLHVGYNAPGKQDLAGIILTYGAFLRSIYCCQLKNYLYFVSLNHYAFE